VPSTNTQSKVLSLKQMKDLISDIYI